MQKNDTFIRKIVGQWPSFTPYFILLIVIWSAVNTSFKKDYKNGKIEADAKGYYAYLPAVFIYHDLNFNFYNQIERERYYNQNLDFQYLREHNNRTINKYYVGTAICLFPFWSIGHIITLFTNLPADGYSYYYTLMAHIGAFFYLIFALIGLRKLLLSFFIDKKTIALVSIAIVLGTNLFYYVITEFAMSHIYSFAIITWFCLSVKIFFSTHKPIYLIYIGLLLGMIVLLRPINILIILIIPFLAESKINLLSGFNTLYTKKWHSLAAILSFVILISIQLLIYKISTDSFLVYSYKKEGFNLLNPQIWNFLFSYRKGMFVYTPILFLSLTGFIYLYRSNRFQFYTLLGFLMLLVYVFSSWFMWFYGGSFSQRVMIEYYAIFAILLSITLQNIPAGKLKSGFLGLLFLVILFCQIQTYQYRHMQIHWSDMNKEKYWDVFLRIDKL